MSEIRSLDAEIVAISTHGNRNTEAKTKSVLKIAYTIVPGPERKTPEAFGVWNSGRNLAVATVILDRAGVVRFVYDGVGDYDRPSASDVIRKLKEINQNSATFTKKQEIAEISIPEPAPKKEPGKIKIENGFVVFPQDNTPDVKIKEDLKFSLSPDSPEEIRAIQGKIYGTKRGEDEKMIYLIPAGYDSGIKKIKLLYVTDNKGTQWKPEKTIIEGIYHGSEGSAVKNINDKSDKPWARLHIISEKQSSKLRLAWETGGNTDFFPVAEFPVTTNK